MKLKYLAFILIIFIPFCFLEIISTNVGENCCVSAEITNDIIDEIDDQLSDIDFSDIDKIIENLNIDEQTFFGNKTFLEKIKSLICGDYSEGYSSIFEVILSFIFDNILSLLPMIATIIAISILGGLLGNIKSSKSDKSLDNIIHFIIYGMIIILVSSMIIKMITLTNNTLTSIKQQTEIVFPILLTLLTALGGGNSVGAYQPAISIFSSTIIEFFTVFILPLFLVSVVLSILSNLSNSIKLNKLNSFVNSLSKWTIGIIFTIFTSFVAIKGITAGSIDGLSIRTAKFTIKNSLPIVGSYLSDGLYLILISSNLIKNAIGGGGLILLLATVISPLIQIILFILALKLVAGIVEPLGDTKIAGFISSLAKSMSMLIVMIASVSFMYIIVTGLMINSANII